MDTYYYSAGQQHDNKSIFHITGLDPGNHTLTITVLGEKKEESEAANIYISEAVVFKTGDKVSDNYSFE